ncbi:hypothetical protein CDAR_173191 [Caerostris darwini]|uniref:Uncharacterized protein n=1 Tax=Caerostris darwini TaxID=1538125 RepID=A0AAV4WL96_9ARAC|nr:hypothetical protein CDAR_173191 [Caerostris darwini]
MKTFPVINFFFQLGCLSDDLTINIPSTNHCPPRLPRSLFQVAVNYPYSNSAMKGINGGDSSTKKQREESSHKSGRAIMMGSTSVVFPPRRWHC